MRALAALILLLAGNLEAAAGFGSPGTAGADFLKIPSGTRAAGMAGAVAASAEGVEALEFNPARLSSVLGWELGAQHLSYAEGIALEQLSLGWGRQGLGGAFSVLSLSTPDIPSIDISGAQVGTFKQQDLAFSGGLGYALGKLSLGLTARSLQRSIAGLSYGGYEGDVGLAWQPWGGWRLGLAAQHLGSLGALSQEADPTPMLFRGGIGWGRQSNDGLAFVGEVNAVQPRDSSVQLRVGAEAGWSYFFGRAGTQISQAYEGRQPFTVGAGVRVSSWQLDYSFADLQGLGLAHRVGLNWRLDGAYRGRKDLQAPTGLAIKKDGQDLLLTWQEAKNAAGYAVYLRKGQDVDIKRAAQTKAGQARLRLKRAASLPHLGLAVASLSEDGVESALSSELRFGPDQQAATEVAVPSGLRVEKEDGKRVLRWDVADQAGEFSYQVLVSRRSGAGYAPLGKPTFRKEKILPDSSEWRETRFVVVQSLRNGVKGQEASVLSTELQVLPR